MWYIGKWSRNRFVHNCVKNKYKQLLFWHAIIRIFGWKSESKERLKYGNVPNIRNLPGRKLVTNTNWWIMPNELIVFGVQCENKYFSVKFYLSFPMIYHDNLTWKTMYMDALWMLLFSTFRLILNDFDVTQILTVIRFF